MDFEAAAGQTAPFSEKGFYLSEFRGRTLAIACPAEDLGVTAPLEVVLGELAANRTRVVLISNDAAAFAFAPRIRRVAADAERLEGDVWRGLTAAAPVGIVVADAGALAGVCREIALRLRLSKLVWLDRDGGLRRADGERLSFVDLAELRALLAGGLPGETERRRALLREVEASLAEGLPAFNLCALEGLGEELFTYAGAGTLFTRERYVEVRRLGLDDYDAADDLIARGVAEGYLAPRSEAEIDRILANGFGAFVEGRHLAGIGALLVHSGARTGEIASLYTLTRFLGEGIGAHLVGFAVERARELGCSAVIACTTADRVAGFFARQGFLRVGPEALPEEKWRGYDPARRDRLRCLRRELG